jgi:uncharacterized protein (TIGR03086 family)
MEPLEALSQTFDHTYKTVSGVRPDQLLAPTPCSEWDLQALLRHMFGVVANMGLGARGETLMANSSDLELDDDLAGQFRALADSTFAAWSERDPASEVNVGAGPMPAMVGLSINMLDTSMHSWDVARATGQDSNLPDELAQVVLATCQQIVTDEVRGFAGFDPAVEIAAGASTTDQLAAFLGRKP